MLCLSYLKSVSSGHTPPFTASSEPTQGMVHSQPQAHSASFLLTPMSKPGWSHLPDIFPFGNSSLIHHQTQVTAVISSTDLCNSLSVYSSTFAGLCSSSYIRV